MFKSWNLTINASNSVSLVLKFLKGPYIYMSSLVCTKYDINITMVESPTPTLFNHIGNFVSSICYFLNFCSFVCFLFPIWNTSILQCKLGSLSYTNSMINYIVCSSANGCTNCSWNVELLFNIPSKWLNSSIPQSIRFCNTKSWKWWCEHAIVYS